MTRCYLHLWWYHFVGEGVWWQHLFRQNLLPKRYFWLCQLLISKLSFSLSSTKWQFEKSRNLSKLRARWNIDGVSQVADVGLWVPSVISTQRGAQTKPLFSNAWWRLIQSACASNSPPNPQPLIPSLANTCKVTDRGGVAQLNLHSWLKICFSWLCLTIVRVFRLMNYYSVWLWCPVSV